MINTKINNIDVNALKYFFADIAHRIAIKRTDVDLTNLDNYTLYHDEVVSILAEQLATKVAEEYNNVN